MSMFPNSDSELRKSTFFENTRTLNFLRHKNIPNASHHKWGMGSFNGTVGAKVCPSAGGAAAMSLGFVLML